MTDTAPLLVLVHPGSACGSADFNLGKTAARFARDGLCRELADWRGALLVIDGDLSDELPTRPALQTAINDALSRAQASLCGGVRVMGSDPDQVHRIREIAGSWGHGARDRIITVSGAWYHPEDGSGCVGSVIQALQELGFQAQVSAQAVCLPSEDASPEVRDPSPVVGASSKSRRRSSP